ncbi:MAG TPA: hypothetical protein VE621_01425 [Bryobacteraceae bacterium]|jgi:hypothetical protein|nr:hypothetical protein [Bryobacteraceae bacterium]
MRLLAIALLIPTLHAQTTVEGALITGKSATSAAKAGQSAGSSVSKSLGVTARTMQQVTSVGVGSGNSAQQKPNPRLTRVTATEPEVERVTAAAVLPEVAKLKLGMTRDELQTVAGKPTQIISMPEAGKLLERYKYVAGDQELRIVLEDGKVTEIRPISQ